MSLRRDADDQQRLRAALHRFRERLREREMRVERARGQIAALVQLPGIGNPFVNQDEARAELLEQLAEFVARVGRLFVGFLDDGIASFPLPTQLPNCQASSPQRVRTMVPSGFFWGIPGGIRLPTSTARFTPGTMPFPASFTSESTPRKLSGRCAAEQVIYRQHRVRFAAAEVGLKLDDRIAAAALQPPHGADQNCFNPSVMNVRRKNSIGLRYSSDPSPR